MKRILIIILALLITGLAGGYEYRMPVNIQSSTTPAVLMPGDEAILAIQMQNGAAAYGAGKDAGVSSLSSNVLLSTVQMKRRLSSRTVSVFSVFSVFSVLLVIVFSFRITR